MDIPAVIEEFKRYKIGQENKKFSTAHKYGLAMRDFFIQVEKFPDQVIKNDVVEHIIYMKVNKKYSVNTQRLRLSAIKDFYAWFRRRYQYAVDPMDGVASIQEEVKVPIMPTPDELVRLVYECKETTEQGRRDAALICLLSDTGIRISECALLNIGNIQKHENNFAVIVPATKGRWERMVPFGRLIKGDLVGEHFSAYWQEIKFKKLYKDNEPLFKQDGPIHKGGRLGISGIQLLFRKYVRKSGVNSGISAHSMRHFFATYSIIEGVLPTSLQKLMGHAWLSSTERYIHLADVIKNDTVNRRGTAGLKAKSHFTGYTNISRQIPGPGTKNDS